MALSPLVLTGGPAVGKSSSARLVAASRRRAAVIDVDDIRQLVVSGGAAPWQGSEGRRQQHLGVLNACALAQRFVQEEIDVVVADVVTPETLPLYRRLLPGVLVIHLSVPLPEARRRAATRLEHLTEAEFEALHEADRAARLEADHLLDVTAMALDEQATVVTRIWTEGRAG